MINQNLKILIFFFISGILVIIIIAGFVYQNLIKQEEKPLSSENKMNLQNRKIAILIAFRDFRDEEYFIPKGIFESAGAKVQTISTELGTAIGSQGGEAKIDIKIDDLKVADFDAVVFVGGGGAPKYLDNETSYKIAKDAVSQGKILAAICVSPTILAKTGVLSGKKATVWSSVLDKSAVKILKENGAIYENEKVVVDGKIITADGPLSAKEFGEAIVGVLPR